jgi:hypothetical protein
MLIEEKMIHQQCVECGVHWRQPKYLDDQRRQDKAAFYCPNGHGQVYSESEADRLRRELNRVTQQIAQRDDEIKSRDKQIKRMKKREANGTCPCCKRSFSNMATHMKHMHPDFVAENVVPLKAVQK